MQTSQLSKQQTAELVRLYRRHEEWARRSEYFAMDWQDFRRSRLANPLVVAALASVDRA